MLSNNAGDWGLPTNDRHEWNNKSCPFPRRQENQYQCTSDYSTIVSLAQNRAQTFSDDSGSSGGLNNGHPPLPGEREIMWNTGLHSQHTPLSSVKLRAESHEWDWQKDNLKNRPLDASHPSLTHRAEPFRGNTKLLEGLKWHANNSHFSSRPPRKTNWFLCLSGFFGFPEVCQDIQILTYKRIKKNATDTKAATPIKKNK